MPLSISKGKLLCFNKIEPEKACKDMHNGTRNVE